MILSSVINLEAFACPVADGGGEGGIMAIFERLTGQILGAFLELAAFHVAVEG